MDIPLDEVIYVEGISSSSTGAAADADSTPTFAVYEEATDTDIGVGGNMTKRTSLTGDYRASFTASAANGFEAGKWYSVIGSATIGGIACKGVLARFRIVAAEATAGYPAVDAAKWNNLATVELPLVPTTAGRKLDVSAGGEAGVDWANVGSPTTALALTGTTIATTQKVDIETVKTQTVTCAAGVTVNPQVGFSSTNATNLATLAGHDPGETIMGATDLDATLSTIAAYIDTEVAAIKAKTDNLPSDPADASDVASAFSTVNSTLATISSYLDTEIAAILAAVDTEILAIKAKTDNLPSDPADQSILAAAIDAVPLAVWDFDLSGPAFSVFSAGAVLLRVGARVALTGTVDASPAPSASGFTVTLSQAMATGSIDDALLQFSGGTLIHQSKPISAGTAGTGTKMAFTFDEAFTAAPTAGDAIQVVVSHIHPISQIADGVRSELAVELARLDAAVSTRASQTSVDTIGGYLDTEIAAILAAVDTEVAAIKAKTDQLAFTNSGKVDASIQAAADFVTAAANKLADIMARRTTANIEASAFGDTIGLGSLYSVIQQLQKSGPASGATFPIYKSDGTTLLGNLTLSFDPAAEPVTGVE